MKKIVFFDIDGTLLPEGKKENLSCSFCDAVLNYMMLP